MLNEYAACCCCRIFKATQWLLFKRIVIPSGYTAYVGVMYSLSKHANLHFANASGLFATFTATSSNLAHCQCAMQGSPCVWRASTRQRLVRLVHLTHRHRRWWQLVAACLHVCSLHFALRCLLMPPSSMRYGCRDMLCVCFLQLHCWLSTPCAHSGWPLLVREKSRRTHG